MRRVLLLLLLGIAASSAAQQLDFSVESVNNREALAAPMATLARQALALLTDRSRATYGEDLWRLQVANREYRDARDSIISFRQRLSRTDPHRASWPDIQFEIFISAAIEQQNRNVAFEEAYKQAFRRVFARLDNPTAAWVAQAMEVDVSGLDRQLQADLAAQKGKHTIALSDALQLLRDYVNADIYRIAAPFSAALIAEDDGRRYVVGQNLRVQTPDHATLCILVMRPHQSGGARLPALLQFTIYADPVQNAPEARQSAAHGYAGVVGLTRGKGCSPDTPSVYQHDGQDATALIDWIAKQPWSDGRVGMFGGSYSGFTPWAAAKYMPKGLKAIMVGAPVGPGVDVPMEGNVVWNFIYPWPFYTTDIKGLDDATYNDNGRWNRLFREWYVSGRAYRDLDKIDGKPNPVFDEWISHPAYDPYWQTMIPYGKEFARVSIPVLMTAGYFYGGPGAAIYYFSQHYRFNPTANDYLLIGPYDHLRAQRGTTLLLGGDMETMAGYRLDPAAKVNMLDLRYEWFDYVLKGGPRPAVLKAKVNYEVTDANIWKHVRTLAATGPDKLRLYLNGECTGNAYGLKRERPVHAASVPLTVNLADRSDVDSQVIGGAVLDSAVNTANGLKFISDAIPAATEISGLFSGELEFVTNKKDFDFEVDLYDRRSDRRYFQLAQYSGRASYVQDPANRQLLTPRKPIRLHFTSMRFMSHAAAKGSRIVAVLRVIKGQGRQINYGSGKPVSEETIQDAGKPLEIQWFTTSYIELPTAR